MRERGGRICWGRQGADREQRGRSRRKRKLRERRDMVGALQAVNI